MKFIADAMLGKLAKWMRIMGCDVEYFSEISDEDLVERAYSNGRIILTRDTLLVKRRKARNNHFFVTGDSYKDQIRKVVSHFSINYNDQILTRCLLCNDLLLDLDKSKAGKNLPAYVYETQESFKICPSCKRIYWEATHKESMIRQIREMLSFDKK